MRKKQFKAESKKLLDMMINSIYTNKEPLFMACQDHDPFPETILVVKKFV